MSITNIRSALVQAFVASNLFDPVAVQYENILFQAPDNLPWAAVYFVPVPPVVATLGEGGSDEQRGFLQIDLNFTQNSGEKEINAAFEVLRSLFTAGRRFSYSGQEVIILSCGRANGKIINGFFRIPVTVQFYAHVPRS